MKPKVIAALTRVPTEDGCRKFKKFVKRAVLRLFPGGQGSGSKEANDYRAPLPFPGAKVERHAGRVLPFPAPRG